MVRAMVASISLNRIEITPGQKIYLHDINPPPDLAIEIDLTSTTQISAYRDLGVTEIWQYKSNKLAIFVLSEGEYIESNVSSLFPAIPIVEGISQILDRSTEILMSAARKEFRQWVRQILS
jgi:Uma2 family endonuclease